MQLFTYFLTLCDLHCNEVEDRAVFQEHTYCWEECLPSRAKAAEDLLMSRMPLEILSASGSLTVSHHLSYEFSNFTSASFCHFGSSESFSSNIEEIGNGIIWIEPPEMTIVPQQIHQGFMHVSVTLWQCSGHHFFRERGCTWLWNGLNLVL